MTVYDLLAVADFLGDSMTDEQGARLNDEARKLSLSDHDFFSTERWLGKLAEELSRHLIEQD